MTCPAFSGPHLGVAADASLVAAAVAAADLDDAHDGTIGDNGGDDDDNDDDEDGAFGDFWRASVRCADRPVGLNSTGGRKTEGG